MMHAQTILQLYRQLIDSGWGESALLQVRGAYELAQQLFVGCYRPSEKPFCSHLVGTASTLARWGERAEMVTAGLLHSAYLYGEFGDLSRGFSSAKQQFVLRYVGQPAEALIDEYTKATELGVRLCGPHSAGSPSRDMIVLKLADLRDECADGGPLYAPHKPLVAGLPHDARGRQQVLALAEQWIGPVARIDFDRVLQEIDGARIPHVLLSKKRAYHTAQPGVPELRVSKLRRRWTRLAHHFSFR